MLQDVPLRFASNANCPLPVNDIVISFHLKSINISSLKGAFSDPNFTLLPFCFILAAFARKQKSEYDTNSKAYIGMEWLSSFTGMAWYGWARDWVQVVSSSHLGKTSYFRCQYQIRLAGSRKKLLRLMSCLPGTAKIEISQSVFKATCLLQFVETLSDLWL